MRAPCEVGGVRNVGDNAVLGSFANTFLREAKKTTVQVVEQLFADTPAQVQEAFSILDQNGRAVGVHYLVTLAVALLATMNALVVVDQTGFFR